jgi:hypothetical protein
MNNPTENPNLPDFKLVSCDGPELPSKELRDAWTQKHQPGKTYEHDYVPCNFKGAVDQIQHLINIMLVLGVLAAVAGFVWAGYLYVSISFTGKVENENKAKDIFKKVLIGFAVMLCSWFAVFQILAWLSSNSSSATSLLSK